MLSFIEHDQEAPEDAVVMLADPLLTGDVLTYKVEVLDSELPPKAGSCSVFIDALGRPISPVALAGMRRRERRRWR